MQSRFYKKLLNLLQKKSVKRVMLFYDVKLINPETKEVYFHKVAPKPQLPNKEEMEKFAGAMIVISTVNGPSVTVFKDKKAS